MSLCEKIGRVMVLSIFSSVIMYIYLLGDRGGNEEVRSSRRNLSNLNNEDSQGLKNMPWVLFRTWKIGSFVLTIRTLVVRKGP